MRHETDTTTGDLFRRETSTLESAGGLNTTGGIPAVGGPLQNLPQLGASNANAARVAAKNVASLYARIRNVKALSIRQPWAWLIASGQKDIENRSWPLRYRGKLLIHAGTKIDPAGIARCKDWGIQLPEPLETGGVIGMVEVTDCVIESSSRWFCGPFGFVLKNAETLPLIPCRGKLGLFDITIPEHTR